MLLNQVNVNNSNLSKQEQNIKYEIQIKKLFITKLTF